MNFNRYQLEAIAYALPSIEENLAYSALGLAGEAGEYADKYKKILRGDTEVSDEDLVKELGDCLWYISLAATQLGYSLDQVAKLNLAKLEKRRKAGTIQGSGDNR